MFVSNGLLGMPSDVQAQEVPPGWQPPQGLLGMGAAQPLQQAAVNALGGGMAMGGAPLGNIGRFDPAAMQAMQQRREEEEKAKQAAQWLADTRNQPEGGNTEGPN